ncbi:MAG: DUF115 domain-containing protein [Treponema sp.]|jgi:hypothetical protein|nr:DUF115 domain-containing protein [Treponema sp.]
MPGDAREGELQSAAPGDIPEKIEARRGFSVSYKGKNLLSTIDPIGQAERTVETLPLLERTLYLCPSPLFGYGLELLLSKLEGVSDSALLCVEADKGLFEFSLTALNPAIKSNPRFKYTNIGEGGMLCAFVRDCWGPRRFRRIQPIRLTGGWRLTPEIYDSLEESLRREIALDWGNALTLTKLGRRYIRNALRNLALIPRFPSAAELNYGFDPVLVLGAGPSLDDLLDNLARRFPEKLRQPESRPFRIICVDTCLPCLHERGVVPDLAVILESQHWNLRDFIGARNRKVSAAMDLSALPATGRILTGGLFLFTTPWTSLRLFGRLKEAVLLPTALAPLGSVGLSAAELACRLSRGNIITGGIDFSFTLDAYHARSSPGHLDRLRRHNRFHSLLNADAAFAAASFSAPSKSGLPVRSSPAMRNYRNLFEQEFAVNPRLFDINSTGLPLGIKTAGMEEALDMLETGPARRPEAADMEPRDNQPPEDAARPSAPELAAFIGREEDRLSLLRAILTGGTAGAEKLETLLDECDYLWAHFPDCAGAGGRRPPASDTGFLKRVRAEIDPFLKLWRLTSGEICSAESTTPPLALNLTHRF